MSGSAAEERIRGKAEVMLRRLFPDARIIHELVLKQGGVRIDLAAVSPGFLAAIEVKSERDVLTRLPEQTAEAMRVTDLFGVCVAAKHADKIGAYYHSKETVKVLLPYGAHLLTETDEGFITRSSPFDPGWMGYDRIQSKLCNPADRLEMLWADELKVIAGHRKLSRQPAKHFICETMNGRQIREAVCAALRARHFPRADPAIPLVLNEPVA
tara:strand:- start:575 stop:1210 length:636 start_codon:yes stop_codon:yes gene_type:complete